jgi:branched-chain amino acid transport system substrate-binding protein
VGVAKMGKFKKWAVLSPDYTWGRTMWADFVRYYKEIVPDMEIVAEYWPPLGETDYTPYITAILTSKAEAVQSSFVGGDLVTFVSQAKTHGFFEKVAYVNDNSGDVLGVLPFGNKYPEGCIGAACYVPYWKSPDNEDFLKKFKRYNSDPKNKWRSPASLPGFHYTEAYEAIYFILNAITKARTTETEAVIKAGENLAFTIPSGPVTMRAFDHQLARPMFVGRTKVVPDYPIVPMVDGLVMVPPKDIMRTIEKVVADGHPGRSDLPKQFTTGMGLP